MSAIIGLTLGVIVGIFIPYNIPPEYSLYIAVGILAALDSIFGGINAIMQKHYNNMIFVTGFFGNAILAGLLAYIGDKLGVPIYLAAVIVFGGRLFQNFAIIRRHFIENISEKNKKNVDLNNIFEKN